MSLRAFHKNLDFEPSKDEALKENINYCLISTGWSNKRGKDQENCNWNQNEDQITFNEYQLTFNEYRESKSTYDDLAYTCDRLTKSIC